MHNPESDIFLHYYFDEKFAALQIQQNQINVIPLEQTEFSSNNHLFDTIYYKKGKSLVK